MYIVFTVISLGKYGNYITKPQYFNINSTLKSKYREHVTLFQIVTTDTNWSDAIDNTSFQ